MGEYEDVPGFEKLAATIRGYNIEGLEIEAQVIKGSGHAGTKPEGYNRGLQYAFKKPCLNLDEKILDQYVGEYEVNLQFHIKVVREENQLVGIVPGNQKIPICAATEKDFYIKGSYANFHFQKDVTGKVTGFQMERYEGESFAKKIE